MQLLKLLHKTFQRELPFIHKVRLESLMGAVETLISFNKLSLTALGRNYLNKASSRNNIKKMDRLLANKNLHEERFSIYEYVANRLITKCSMLLIQVDWSCINATTGLYLLRASLCMPGRSIAIYEECHPKKSENNHSVHKAFLNRLKALLPKAVEPVIITDAGFRGPWFAYILELGWNFVGRLRNKNLVWLESTETWNLSSHFFEAATEVPQSAGAGLLTEKNRVPIELILYKGKAKKRHKLNINKKRSSASKSKRYSKANKEPWILVTSFNQSTRNAAEIVKIYKKRMQIEENFRDTKSTKYGFGLNESRSKIPDRMNILLLIAAIATFASWLAGLYIRKAGKASDYQIQSAKHTGVLSTVFLGREALKKKFKLLQKQFDALWNDLLDLAYAQTESVF
jgi:hypothetical protein